MNKHQQGVLTEFRAAAIYTELGYTVCWPVLTQSPYDFIAEKDGIFKRVQVKTPTWIKSGNYEYLQCRLGADKRVSVTAAGCKYAESCDEVIFVSKEMGVWIFPMSAIAHTSNICLATTHPKPSKVKKTYNPDDFKLKEH